MSGSDTDGPAAGRRHPDLAPELRQLAQAILDRLDPAVRFAAARAASSGDGPGKCQQVWCPVCALAALVSGEQHPLLTVIAEHSVALLTVIRAIIEDTADTARRPRRREPPDGPPPPRRPRAERAAAARAGPLSAHPGHGRGVGRRVLWSHPQCVGTVVAEHRSVFVHREGPCGIGCSSTSSWDPC